MLAIQTRLCRRTLFTSTTQVHNITRTVPVTRHTMYSVVSQIDQYHNFVPYCEKSWVSARDENGMPILAGLQVGFELYNEKFDCVIECEKDEKVVSKVTQQSNHLFETLYTEWIFKDTPKFGGKKNNANCQVTLQLQFKFHNPIYNQVSKVFGDKVSSIMIKAFEQRALQLTKVN